MNELVEGIEVLCHSSIRMNKGKVIYFDPYKIDGDYNDADIIFITHDHYDHYSEEDINKVRNDNTIIVAPYDLENKILNNGFSQDDLILVEPNQEYKAWGISFKTVPAYNIGKNYHPRENNWVGYIVDIDWKEYYIAGDTDITDENRNIQCDVAFVPISGTYTMTAEEAAELVNEIRPKVAVPIHYGEIVGTKEDAERFVNLVDLNIDCEFLR